MSSASLPAQVIVIAGPTAVGKSATADCLAQRWGTEVLSADAMQVYTGMDIGTAKTPVSERPVPLRLVDIVSPASAYSAALYQQDARAFIDEMHQRGTVALMCGGTGLYINAALDDMRFPSGEFEDERRLAYQELASSRGGEYMHRLLAERDPKSAEVIHPHNVRRVIRALEMADDGLCYADQKAGFATPKECYPSKRFCLSMNREELYRRIDARVDAMIELGLVDEVKRLLEMGLQRDSTASQAIGYKEILQYLDGKLTLDEAIELIKRGSRRYAKRQLSWFRRDARYRWIEVDGLSASDVADEVQRLIEGVA